MPNIPPRAGCAQQENAALQNTAFSVNPLGGFELDTFYQGGRVPSTREYIARAHAESHAQYDAAIEILEELGGRDCDHPSMREMQARKAHDMLRYAASASGKLIGCLLRFREFSSGIFPAGSGIWDRQEQAGVLLFEIDLTFRREDVCPVFEPEMPRDILYHLCPADGCDLGSRFHRPRTKFSACDHHTDRRGCISPDRTRPWRMGPHGGSMDYFPGAQKTFCGEWFS